LIDAREQWKEEREDAGGGSHLHDAVIAATNGT
jgi:hypothetical protein